VKRSLQNTSNRGDFICFVEGSLVMTLHYSADEIVGKYIQVICEIKPIKSITICDFTHFVEGLLVTTLLNICVKRSLSKKAIHLAFEYIHICICISIFMYIHMYMYICVKGSLLKKTVHLTLLIFDLKVCICIYMHVYVCK